MNVPQPPGTERSTPREMPAQRGQRRRSRPVTRFRAREHGRALSRIAATGRHAGLRGPLRCPVGRRGVVAGSLAGARERGGGAADMVTVRLEPHAGAPARLCGLTAGMRTRANQRWNPLSAPRRQRTAHRSACTAQRSDRTARGRDGGGWRRDLAPDRHHGTTV